MKVRLGLVVLLAVIFVQATLCGAQTILTVVENQVTSSAFYETTPTLGNDGTGDLVVYTARELLNTGMFDQSDIYYQPLISGQADSPAIQVTASLTDDVLNDVSGDYIVYSAFDDTMSLSGSIMLYRISTGQLRALGYANVILDPKIHGNYVLWLQGSAGATEVILYDINTNAVRSLAGPVPPAFHVQIGSRFAVWASLDGDYDVVVYDFELDARYAITATANTDERYPSTSGDWVVWQSIDAASPMGRIEAYNGRTGEMRVIVDDGAKNRLPSLYGDLIAWEANPAGNFDVFVHRLDLLETFQVTTDPGDQNLNDLFGGLVAYVDQRGGNEDIYVSTLTFADPDPCLTLGGDSDADAVCDDNDNCPLVANPAQADFDSDGVGDVCDNCPVDTNPDQADLNGDGIGDVCDVNADITPPNIELSVTPDVLWPPNHKLVPIGVHLVVTDDMDPDPTVLLVSITSNELDAEDAFDINYDQLLTDGKTSGDIIGDENGDIFLRAERAGKGDGRIYIITFQATDASGNTATASTTVSVPHNQ